MKQPGGSRAVLWHGNRSAFIRSKASKRFPSETVIVAGAIRKDLNIR